MRNPAEEPNLLKAYLLGVLSEDIRDKVEERLMTDDGCYQEIVLAEDELIDEYLEESLTGDERARFEEHFLSTIERQQKLRFAKALHEYVRETALQAAPAEVQSRPRLAPLRRFVGLFGPPGKALVHALAAAAILAMVLVPIYSGRMTGLQAQLDAIEAQQHQTRRENDTLSTQVEASRLRIQELEDAKRKVSSPEPAPTPPPVPTTIALTLTSGLRTRGAGSIARLNIPSTAALVELRLDLGSDDYPGYRAVLSTEGEEIMTRSGLKAQSTRDSILVVWRLPPDVFVPADYEITLLGLSEGADPEAVATFVFRVSRN